MSTDAGTTPRVVVLDLGNVVVTWEPRWLYQRLIPDPEQREEFLGAVCTPAWNATLDAGADLATAIAELSAQHPRWTAEIEAWRTHWPEMLGGPVPGTTELVDDLLAAGVRVCALSNWSTETYPHAVERYDVLGRFDDVVISGEIGLVKPDPAIYRYAVERFGVEPADCLFVDDLPANVAGARAVGMPAELFTGADVLRADPRIQRLLST